MPRRPNTKPTNIYWLIDTRPETIASGWPIGKPFYCGKTVHSIRDRLSDHQWTARHFPRRKVSQMLNAAGDAVVVRLMEVVPLGISWSARERHWIRVLRHLNPGCANVSDGGDGPAGMIHSAATREKLRQANLGRKQPPEVGRKISLANKGRKRSQSAIDATAAARRGAKVPQEQREKIRATLTGYKHPPEFGQKIAARLRGRKMPPEFGRKISAARKGKPLSAEHRAKLSAAKKGKPMPQSVRNAAIAYHRGRPKSDETRAKMSAAQKGRQLTPAHIEALRAGQKRRRERERELTNYKEVVK
jgi:hypothetical protein